MEIEVEGEESGFAEPEKGYVDCFYEEVLLRFCQSSPPCCLEFWTPTEAWGLVEEKGIDTFNELSKFSSVTSKASPTYFSGTGFLLLFNTSAALFIKTASPAVEITQTINITRFEYIIACESLERFFLS